MITGTFDRASLTLTPDRPNWAAAVLAGDHTAAKHWAYDYGPFSFPKTSGQDGRRIIYAWLNFKPTVPVSGNVTWTGMHSVPREITSAKVRLLMVFPQNVFWCAARMELSRVLDL